MTEWPPYLLYTKSLVETDAQLAASPESVELRFSRACLLVELGRREEAKTEYMALVRSAPGHVGVLNNFGKLLQDMGYSTAAMTLYVEAVKHHPDNPAGHINLANMLMKKDRPEEALEHFQTALRLDPGTIDAHQGLAYYYKEKGDEAQSQFHQEKGYRDRPVLTLGYCGTSEPVRVLLLASAGGGMVPVRHHLDERVFLASVLYVEYFDPAQKLPPHDFVFNIIGDADRCRPSLELAVKLAAETTAPVLNHPSHVLLTGRADNARRMGNIPGVVTAKTLLLPREQLESPDVQTLLAREGFAFPLLLRAPGFHTGIFFLRLDSMEDLAKELPAMPGAELMVIEYLDARSNDGNIRKYRVMMIDGALYPLHAAISHEWKIHYFSADMADNPQNRAEDEAFLSDMKRVLGAHAMKALEAIQGALGLDYAGIDFSVSAKGEIILFEANATMIVNHPDADARWDYRRPAVQRIMDAIDRLLLKHAGSPAASQAAYPAALK